MSTAEKPIPVSEINAIFALYPQHSVLSKIIEEDTLGPLTNPPSPLQNLIFRERALTKLIKSHFQAVHLRKHLLLEAHDILLDIKRQAATKGTISPAELALQKEDDTSYENRKHDIELEQFNLRLCINNHLRLLNEDVAAFARLRTHLKRES